MGHVSEAFTRDRPGPLRRSTSRCGTTTGSVFDLPPAHELARADRAFFGHELADDLIWVESVDGDVQLAGYVANPSHSRSNNRDAVSVPQRPAHSRPLAAARAGRGLSRAAADRPLSDRLSALEMPPRLVDVNVHPDEARSPLPGFAAGSTASCSRTLRTKFLSTDLTRPGRRPERGQDPTGADVDAHSRRGCAEELVDWAKGQAGRVAATVAAAGTRQPTFDVDEPLPLASAAGTERARPPLGRRPMAAREDGPTSRNIESAGDSAEALALRRRRRPDAARAPPGRCRCTIATW